MVIQNWRKKKQQKEITKFWKYDCFTTPLYFFLLNFFELKKKFLPGHDN